MHAMVSQIPTQHTLDLQLLYTQIDFNFCVLESNFIFAQKLRKTYGFWFQFKKNVLICKWFIVCSLINNKIKEIIKKNTKIN